MYKRNKYVMRDIGFFLYQNVSRLAKLLNMLIPKLKTFNFVTQISWLE